MIQNQRQHEVTLGRISRLQGALELSRKTEGKMDPRIFRAMIAGIEGQVEELRQQLRDYDALKSARMLRLNSADELGLTRISHKP